MRDYEVTVVDNASTDGSAEWVRLKYPLTKIIQLPENAGFAKAVNDGIRSSDSRFVALINNDIELKEDWLSVLVHAIEGFPDVGSVACKMLNFYNRNVIDAAGDELSRNGNAGGRGHGQRDSERFNSREYVFGACAGAALYRRDVLNEVGFFDEDFFAWYEDVDLDLRMQLRGFSCIYVPTAVCYHKRGGTVKNSSALSVRLHVRNNLLYVTKNFPFLILLLKSPRLLVSRIKKWNEHIREGNGKAVFDGVKEYVRMLPPTIAKRRKNLAARTVSDRYFARLFTKPGSSLGLVELEGNRIDDKGERN